MRSFLTLLSATALAVPALADGPALSFAAPGEYRQDSYCLGWYFDVTTSATVSAIGFYDDLDGTDQNHPVGLYDVAAGAFVASTTVLTTDPKAGFFRYHDLAAPFALVAGRRYALVGVTFNDFYNSFAQGTSVDPRLSFIGGAIDYSGGATGLVPPVQYYPTNGSYWPTTNMMLSPVPEPASMVALSLGAAAMLHRRKKA